MIKKFFKNIGMSIKLLFDGCRFLRILWKEGDGNV